MNEQLALPNLALAVVPLRTVLDIDVDAVSRPAGTYMGDFYYTSMKRTRKQDARFITRAFMDLVVRHQAGTRPHDDLTILTLRIR